MPERLCSSCEVPLSANAAGPVCPRCALAVALAADSGAPESFDKGGRGDGSRSHHDAANSSSVAPLRSTVRYFGDYELIEEIATGGMGVVFKARQITLNRLIAVKMLLPGLVATEDRLRRFHTEAEAAASLSHPNIVAIHEIGEHEGQHYFSMDYIEGEDLARHTQRTTISTKQAAVFLVKISEAIHHAHQRGILHRDLKPANILVGPGDEPFVTDFGIAKLLHDRRDMTQSGQVLGTPSFMSPEQADPKHGEVTTASDVYSLGAICYYMLTRQSPFRCASVEQTLLSVLNDEPKPPRQLNPAVPRDLETICLKCLSKEPARRYANAQDLANDLRRFLSEEPIHARPVGSLERVWLWSRRNPIMAALVLGLAIVMASASVVSTVLWRRAETNAVNAAASRELAETRLFVSDMQLAERMLAEGKPYFARRLLWAHSQESNRLDLAWRLRATQSEGEAFELWSCFSNMVWVTETSPDGTIIVARDSRGVLEAHSTRDKRLLWSAKRVTSITGFTPDGRSIAVSDFGHTVRVLSSQDGTQTLSISNAGQVVCLVQGGRTIVTAGTNFAARLWSIESGRLLAEWSGPSGLAMDDHLQPRRLAVSEDGRLGAVGGLPHGMAGGGEMSVWDFQKRERIAFWQEDRYPTRVVFSPDGKHLIWGQSDGTLCVKSTDQLDQSPRRMQGAHSSHVRQIVFTPTGRRFATCSDDLNIRFWEYPSMRLLGPARGQVEAHLDVKFYPNSDFDLVACHFVVPPKTWRLRESLISPPSLTNRIEQLFLAFSPEGKWIACGNATEGVFVLNPETFERVGVLTNAGSVVPNGWTTNGLVTIASDVQVWDPQTQTLKARFPLMRAPDGGLPRVSPDGRLLAVVHKNPPEISVYEIPNQRFLKSFLLPKRITQVCFSRDSQRLFASNTSGEVFSAEIASGRFELFLETGGTLMYGLEISPDNTVLATSWHNRIRLWRLSDRQELGELIGHNELVECVAFSPDGSVIASASQDGTVKLWSLSLKQEIASLKMLEPGEEGEHRLLCVVAAPDDNSLAAVSNDGHLKIWHAKSFEALRPRREAQIAPAAGLRVF